MPRQLISLFLLLILAAFLPSHALSAEEAKVSKDIESFTAGMVKHDGFVPFYWDQNKGKIFLQLSNWEREFLYVTALTHGVGSNDLGQDRGKLGSSRLVTLRKVGTKVLLVQRNTEYRVLSNNPAEKKAVEESFAQSILWGFPVVAQENNKVLVDATDFCLRDAMSLAQQWKQDKEGNYRLEPTRSAIYMPRTKSFPKNTEMEATLTFTGNAEGKHIRTVVPDGDAITVHVHHSFIALPDRNYQPREFHPQCGFFPLEFKDYSSPLGEPLEKRYILRHRLQKKNPEAAISEPVQPIIYYVDRGAPEPIRTALLEGARWWEKAFEAAGFKNAYRVEILPEEADPMDVRLNIIQWVHRSTRGWSYGSNIHDPRTGEIICGRVTLGSLRVRQDMILAEGLLSPFGEGKKISEQARDMALARLRQLSAHEVGHTLGLAHNFAASVHGNGSVMDYPHPDIRLDKNGMVDLSAAYGVGIGPWDTVAIRYGYSEFDQRESEKLIQILANARKQGLEFLSDADARPASGAHPSAHLWDNGKNPIDQLDHLLKVRQKALAEFGERTIPVGMPMALLEERLVPVYLLHRYQVDAVVKLIGGVHYDYSLRGEDEQKVQPVAPAMQAKAMAALLRTLDTKALALPKNILQSIPPRPLGYGKNRELFPRHTGVTFDPLACAQVAADQTISLLLHPARCARIVEQHALDSKQQSLANLLDKITKDRWLPSESDDYPAELGRVVDNVLLHHLLALALDKSANMQVRALAESKLHAIAERLKKSKFGSPGSIAHIRFTLKRIEDFQQHPETFQMPRLLDIPPGMPIGSMSCECCRQP